MVDEPVVGLPGGISVPDDSIHGLLGAAPLLCWKESAMQGVRECEEEGCVEGTMVVMGIEDGVHGR